MTIDLSPDLYWLPQRPADWRQRVRALSSADGPESSLFTEVSALAKYRLDFSAVNALDAATCSLLQRNAKSDQAGDRVRPARIAFLSSSTSGHLHSALRIGGLRRGRIFDLYEPDFGQYRQVIADPHSALYKFAPDFIIFAFDAVAVARHARDARTEENALRIANDTVANMRDLWMMARDRTNATIIQQTIMPRFADAGGSNGHRLPSSPAAFIDRINSLLRAASDEAGIDLLALDRRIARNGIDRWFSASSWHGAKQEIALPATPVYGDMVASLIAARQGRSAKCCVFDLDHTLWGGVVGDDGLQGIVIGPGSAAGEAFLDLQHYALELKRRGILLAVCSKNDEANALEPFLRHADMALKRDDIACFIANWNDKASNIREIASRLNIGLDTLVFVDDNPFERELVRENLPEVFVPEIPEDPAYVASCLSDSGCFEMVTFTAEDALRAEFYSANEKRDSFRTTVTDLNHYLEGLEMVLQWARFTEDDIPRVTQLINKTNQFNLTTRRLGENEVREIVTSSNSAGIQLRLLDRFGDNGIIAIVTGHLVDDATFVIDDWLMSCRVLGRQVEDATLNIIASVARRMGASRLRGLYRPTKKNSMVANLLERLGFAEQPSVGDETIWSMSLDSFTGITPALRIVEL